MKSNKNNNDLLGLSAIIIGILLVILGLSRFILPVLLIIVGFMFISFGLRKRNLAPLKFWVIKLITKLK